MTDAQGTRNPIREGETPLAGSNLLGNDFRPEGRRAAGRWITAFGVGLLLLSGTALAAATPTPPETSTQAAPPGKLLDQVIAVINDQPILASTLNRESRQISTVLQAQGTPIPPANVLRHQVLNRLITKTLELQMARRLEITVNDDQLNRVLAEIAQRNHLTLAQLPQALKTQGQSYTNFRNTIRNQLIIRQLEQQEVAANIVVTPAEIRQYIQRENRAKTGDMEYKLAQILLAFPANAGPGAITATLKQAQKLESKLQSGGNFSSLAVAKSAGPNALKGGTIGWRKGADLPTIFAAVVPRLKPGEISAPIEGPSGYHIIKLLAVRKPRSRLIGIQYHVKRILIRPNPIRTLKQSFRLAVKLRDTIKAGKTRFAAAAREYSDDPNSAGNGGDLGWISPGNLAPPVAKAVTALAPGQISRPIKTLQGWELVELIAKRKHNMGEDARRNAAYQAIFQRKLREQLAQFKRTLRDQAYIHILDPSLANPVTGQGKNQG